MLARSSTDVSGLLPLSIAEKAKMQLFQEIADDLKIRMEAILNAFIIRMDNGFIQKEIVGFTFDLNGAAAARTCNDKTATAAILQRDQVAHVEHILASDCDPNDFAKQYDYNLVCKPKNGKMGNGVVRVRKPNDLQKALSTISELCLSPYYEIEGEHRVVMLNHIPLIAFEKVKPQIVGDGKSTVAQLVGNYFSNTPPTFLQKMKEFKPAWLPLGNILNPGEVMHLQWKHNIFTARVLDPNQEASLIRNIHELAIAATKSLGITFCCVDIIAIKGGGLRVLEVNASVCLEAREIGYENVKKIYTSAVSLMLKIPEI